MEYSTQDLLTRIMSNEVLTPGDLDNLIKYRVKEDTYLDYKHGKLLNGPKKKASNVLREYLSAFANSDGGVLIIGMDEKDERATEVTGALLPKGGNLLTWARDCISPIAASFSPHPRFQIVTHPKGEVLVVATARSRNYIYVIEDGNRELYVRFGDQTRRVEGWLQADLIHGRREHANLTVSSLKVQNMAIVSDGNGSRYLSFYLNFVVENESLTWAEQIVVGIVYYSEKKSGEDVGEHLRQHVDAKKHYVLKNAENLYSNIQHTVISQGRIYFDPFSTQGCRTPNINILERIPDEPVVWQAAIYILAKGSHPIWYQVSLAVNRGLYEFLYNSSGASRKWFDNEVSNKFIGIELCLETRPSIGLSLLEDC